MDCKDKIAMFISSDEKRAELLKNPEAATAYMKNLEKIISDASLSAGKKRELAQKAFGESQEYLSKKILNEARDLEKVTTLVSDSLSKIQKTAMNVKDAVLSHWERSYFNPSTVYDRASSIYAQLDNPIKDTLASRGHLENAASGNFDLDIYEVLRSGVKHTGDNASIINEIATIYKNSGVNVYNLFNENGAFIKFRDDHAITMRHDFMAIAQAGEEKWIAKVYPLLDKVKTFGKSSPSEHMDILKNIYKEMTENSLDIDAENPQTVIKKAWSPDKTISNLKTYESRRALHWLDGASWQKYNAEFGGNKPLLLQITERNKSTSKAIALMEKFGVNARENYERYTQNMITLAGKDLSVVEKNKILSESKLAYDIFTGRTDISAPGMMASVGEAVRGAAALAHLGKAVTASLFYDPFAIAMHRYINTGANPLMSHLEAFTKNIANMTKYWGVEDRVQFAKDFGLAIDRVEESFLDKVYADGVDRTSKSRTRGMLNVMYTYTGATHANKVARLTGVMAAVEDISSLAKKADSYKWKKEFTARTGITASEMGMIADVFSNPQGNITGIKDKATQQKLMSFLSASFDAASPGVDAKFKRTIYQGNPRGTYTGEFLRAIGQYKGASFAQTYAFGEVIRASKPNPMSTPLLGNIGHAAAPITYLAVSGIAMGMARYAIGKWADGKADEIDLTSPNIYKAAVQSSGAFGGAFADIIVPMGSLMAGQQTKAATFEQYFGFLTPSGSYGISAVNSASTIGRKKLQGKDLTDSEIDQFLRLMPYNNAIGISAIREFALDFLSR